MSRRRRNQVTRSVRDLKVEELVAIVARTRGALSADDHAKLKAAIDTLAFLTAELQATGTSLDRLRRLLFGAPTEKTRTLLGADAALDQPDVPPRAAGSEAASPDAGAKPQRPGHGRIPVAAYTGATRVTIAHPTLHSGDGCPGCLRGKVYPLREPACIVRITGMAPLGATVYVRDRLRCNLCGEVFTAPLPEGIGEVRYDETATSMVGLLKYGAGLPFHRIEVLQRGLGIPLPAATQWELVRDAAALLAPVFAELLRQAAQGEIFYNDDTVMKILALTVEQRRAAAADEDTDERTGVFTSAIVAVCGPYRIALFFTGRRHAGENLAAVLAQRAAELGPPIQMSDALAANTTGDFATILANCLAHARRNFVDVVHNFPAAVRVVLETLREVYHNDAIAREQGLSPDDRLRFHQIESGPLMATLKAWLDQQIDEHRVEPNSGLGQAIAYMRKHWAPLTLFLRVPGAPLDNNICERALKKAILHRKNALFYKTENGARVGDAFMSLIHTAELNGIAPFDYLVVLQRHHEAVARAPSAWLPWNYQETLARLDAQTASPT
jgi:hypothetical protein